MIFSIPPDSRKGDRRRASIKSGVTQAAELLSFEDATEANLSYSGFYWTLDLEQNAELRILLRCSPTPIFRSRQSVDRSAWKIKPAAYCDEQHIIQFWDDILRFIATIKLKETTASAIFRRLNSYSKQHGLYHALKAFGQILKSIFILRVIDGPGLRMSIEKVLSGIEHVHAFTRAVSVGNPREFMQAEKKDQKMAEASKRLIKNCIICWNYLYLSQKLAEIDDPAKREQLLQAMAHGSAGASRHPNLLRAHDFSEDKLQDSVGIKLPKLTD